MEYLKTKIEFYRQRTFSEKLNTTFAFIRENWKPLFKYSFYLIMPVCLIQTFAMNSLIIDAATYSASGAPSGAMYSFIANYGILFLCAIIGMAVMSGMIYAMMQTYSTRENGLIDVTLNDFKGYLTKNITKHITLFFLLFFIYILSVVIMGLLAYISLISLALTIPMLFAVVILIILMAMLLPVYIFERDITLIDAVKKAWKFGVTTFWGMLGLMFVLYMISSVIQTVTMMPWYITVLVGSILSVSSEAMITQSIFYKFAIYLLGLIQSFGMYISMTIGLIGLAFQYFHAREKVEGVTIETNISHFDEL